VFNRPTIPTVQAADVTDDAFLLDVREPGEWDAGHAPGAHHVEMMTVPARLDQIPDEGTVVVICRHGHRSAQVVNYLRGQGRDNVVNLDGGIVDWVSAGRPIVTDDGRDPYIA
jgi:rhodanese-related sulfurtransferase